MSFIMLCIVMLCHNGVVIQSVVVLYVSAPKVCIKILWGMIIPDIIPVIKRALNKLILVNAPLGLAPTLLIRL
jgi:hypothetical protein